ncbi:nuclear transport factor 2 family protein [Paraglaciecola arctica]|uniref:nuclear transport factor 2 family protein n=1 Tax=Paraglaciecola arctica TaxID=1128911 RepID=UPI001C07E2D8|nr:nuclear transport factor 2 family protein [Paraglaciecola arctica]MBU3003673.1 nuclear transport factor 2 family protein [Paraglaciecola arctica]
MKNTLMILIFLLLTFSVNAQKNTQLTDIEAITIPLQNYLSGHIKGDKNVLGKALHSEGKLSYLRDGKYAKLEFSDYLSRMKLRNKDDSVERIPYIKSIDVTGNVAVAKLVLDYSSIIFTDYMTLLKIAGEWKISNKIAYSVRDPKNNKTRITNITEIMALLLRYEQALKSGDPKDLAGIFHAEAKIMSSENGKFRGVTLNHFKDRFAQKTSKAPVLISHKIQSVDAFGDAAVAKIQLNYPNSTITHYLSLLRINGQWQVVNKAIDKN